MIDISIHALLAESDSSRINSSSITAYFYPRSPCGERRWRLVTILSCLYFYPRSPCGERRAPQPPQGKSSIFLSTLSLRRATRLPTALRTPHHKFLSTLSLRRATFGLFEGVSLLRNFYPRSPCGERQAPPYNLMIQHAFLSTLSLRRATKSTPAKPFSISDFYPRSPCGERH